MNLRWARRWWPLSGELLRGEDLRSTIATLWEVVSLPRLSITLISLGCTTRTWLRAWCHVQWGSKVKLGSAWKWRLGRQVTTPRWRMNLIWGLPELSVFAQYICSIIVRCSHIVFWALLWATQPTQWSHISCLRWRSVRWHHMWTKDGGKQIINSICDFEWTRVELRISKVAVTFGGIKASYIHLICHELWRFTAPFIHVARLRKRNRNHIHPALHCYMLKFI
jgi:hypothetical protein